MIRFLAILVACIIMFATTGAHRAVASYLDGPEIVTMDSAVERSKAPCCKTYKVEKDHQVSACNLPLVMLPNIIQLGAPKSDENSWTAQTNQVFRGQLCGPGEQPPKTA